MTNSDSNPYLSSQVAGGPPERSRPPAIRLGPVLAGTSIGCVLATLLGYWLVLRTDSALPAVLAIGLLPAAGAYIAGIHDRWQLSKIAVYAAATLLLGYALRPRVAGVRPPDQSTISAQIVVFAFVPASALAIACAGLIWRKATRDN